MAKKLEQRFWDKVDKTDNCWLWTASKRSNGYVQFKLADTMVLAHRLSYELVEGDIPKGQQLDHTCEVKHCVNPEHLKLTTGKQNVHASYKRKDPDWTPGKKFLLYIHDERFEDERHKSKLVNDLLEQHYSPTIKVNKSGTISPKDPAKPSRVTTKPLLNIPGVEIASEAKCKGTHYMLRKDCGKLGCPWG